MTDKSVPGFSSFEEREEYFRSMGDSILANIRAEITAYKEATGGDLLQDHFDGKDVRLSRAQLSGLAASSTNERP